MLKENWRLISRIERVGDVLIIILSFFAAYYSRGALLFWNEVFGLNLPFEGERLAPLSANFVVLIVAIIAYLVSLNVMGAYSSMRLSSHWRLLRVSLTSSALVFFTLAATLFLLKIDLSRSFIGLFCLLVGIFLTAERYLVLRILRFWRSRGRNFRNILICGIGEQALRVAKEVASRPELGIRVRAFADLGPTRADSERVVQRFKQDLREAGLRQVGYFIHGTAALQKALNEYAVDEVIFTDVVEVMPQVEEMVLVCSEQGVRTTIAADLFSIGMVKSGISYFGGMPLIHFQTPPGDRWELAVKRGIDVVIAALLLLVLAIPMAVIAFLIKRTSPGPVFYSQTRVGLNGRLFNLHKFRSMVDDADKQLEALRELNEMVGPAFKLKNDPRVTPIGRWLRRLSIDELPQLWNVLVGEMSLVGPRPPVPGEVSLYERKDRRRLSMRPGLTCTWQVSGRNNIKDFDSWVKLDLEYIDNWSLSRDFMLLFRTIPAVLFGVGAR
ncbi:MAG: sugar transferase [Deltaproteobacteria bacterium]|nr:sugar transferase [Deltaproteobacteria bacterium]